MSKRGSRGRGAVVVAVVVVAVVVAGIVGISVAKRGGKGTPVQTAVVAREDLQAKVSANGKVQAQKKVDISATIAGQVTKLAVKEGDRVTKGQFLLEIDPAITRAAAESAAAATEALRKDLDAQRANLVQARIDYQRAAKNWAEKIIAQADYDHAKTAVKTAEAAVLAAERRVEQANAEFAGAQDSLKKTRVLAPMDGVVTAKRIEEGEVAVIGILNSPGTVLLQISDMSIVEAEMEVDETSVPSVLLGQAAQVRVDAYPNKTFDGVVTEVGSSPMVRTNATDQAIKFRVKIQIKNPPPDIKPGLSVQADILTGFRPNALAVPIQSLVVRDAERKPEEKAGPKREEEGVYLVESGKVRFQKVATGLMGELSIEVLDGLKGGETVVTGPFRTLRALKPGEQVKPEEKKAGAPGQPDGRS
ncbi:MAG: efflux RND transporter periplasmic adaptor subunit [Candidatus Polarisedimenticolia bacterium]|nr:efflux RND transporter periplasmic adaptor subunit [bacterium]